ncbi:hypothetical protein ACTHQ4_20110 [Alkalicoccobacillus gibsonii]|uniref:hypothetical protein n=1 Tax=Alkalicoccobacillus gibsonii TaxID=79881 RepID=UPI003F7B8046
MIKSMKLLSVFLCFLLFSSTVLPNVAAAATSSEDENLLIEENFGIQEEHAEIELPVELQELEDEISDYLGQFEYTEDDYESMSDEEFELVYQEIFESEEFLELESTYEEEFAQFEANLNQDEMQIMIAPILIPIAAAVGRVALQTIVKQGTKIASKYLKNKLKSVGKNYKLIWNSKNSKGKVTSLLKIQHKKTKQMVFRIDNGTIPLKPGSSSWYWHYHIGGTNAAMKHHYSLRSIVPSKHKPASNTTLY